MGMQDLDRAWLDHFISISLNYNLNELPLNAYLDSDIAEVRFRVFLRSEGTDSSETSSVRWVRFLFDVEGPVSGAVSSSCSSPAGSFFRFLDVEVFAVDGVETVA